MIFLSTRTLKREKTAAQQEWNEKIRETDLQVLESIQWRATTLVKGMEGMPYEERLRTLGLPGLEQRRLKGNLIALYSFLRRTRGERGACLFALVWTFGNGTKLHQGDSD